MWRSVGPEPARVLETDVRQHLHARTGSRWWRRSGRRARPRSRPPRRPRAPARSRPRRSAPRTASRGRRRSSVRIDHARPPARTRADRRGEVARRAPAARRPRSARRTSAGAARGRCRCAAPCALQQRGDHPRGRGLAVRPHHVDRGEALLGRSRARSSAGACGRGRTACRTSRGRAGSAPPARGSTPQLTRALQLGPLGSKRSSFSRSACTTSGGAFAVKPSLRELARARARSRSAAAACARVDPRSASSGSTLSLASTSTVAPPSTDRCRPPRRSPPSRGRSRSARGRAIASAESLVRRRRRSGPGSLPPAGAPDASRGSCAGGARPRSPLPPPLGLVVEQLGVDLRIRAHGEVSPRAPGRNEWISSVTNGMIGCASASVSLSTYSSVAETVLRSPSSSQQARLDHLQVPVAQLALEERVELVRGVREVVALDQRASCARSCAAAATGSSGPRRCRARRRLHVARPSAAPAATRSTSCSRAAGPAGSSRPSSARPATTTSRAARSAPRPRRARRSRRAGRSPCRATSTSGGRRAPG